MCDFLKNIDLSNYRTLLLLYLFFFLIILVRYLVISGAYYLIFLHKFKKYFFRGILVKETPKVSQWTR